MEAVWSCDVDGAEIRGLNVRLNWGEGGNERRSAIDSTAVESEARTRRAE